MSKGELLIIGKLALTFAVLLGIPLWELYSLRRDRQRDEKHKRQRDRSRPAAPSAVPRR